MSGGHLCAAAEVGDVKKLVKILRHGAVDVNDPAGENGETALIEAAYTGNKEVMDILLSCPDGENHIMSFLATK